MIRIRTGLAAVLLGALLVLAVFSFQPSLAQAPTGGTVVLTDARLIDGAGLAPLERCQQCPKRTDEKQRHTDT